jgi:uncharacterized protein DUF5666
MQKQTGGPRTTGGDLPSPAPDARWRWSTARRAMVGTGVVAAALSLGTVAAGAATTGTSAPPSSARGGAPPGMTKPTAAGKITALSGDDITLKDKASTTVTVVYSSSTTFRAPSGSASASDLKVGESIAVTGTKNNDGTISATSIMVGGPPAGRGGPPGHPGGKPPAGGKPPSGSGAA